MSSITQSLPPIILTSQDFASLDSLLDASSGSGRNQRQVSEYLERELSRAHVVAEHDLPPNTVKMHSTVRYKNSAFGTERKLTLVYPHEADIGASKISILTPIGAALIGMSAGNSITYTTPGGGEQTLTVIAVE